VSDETYNLALRIPVSMIARLDALKDTVRDGLDLTALMIHPKVSRSTVARIALLRGVEALEAGGMRPAPNPEPIEAPPVARTPPAEPDAAEPASAFLREYRKPSRMTKPATVGGAMLRRWRQGEGLSQAKAAKMLGIAQSSYSAVETGKRQPTKQQAAKLGKVAGISPDDWTTPADGEG